MMHIIRVMAADMMMVITATEDPMAESVYVVDEAINCLLLLALWL